MKKGTLLVMLCIVGVAVFSASAVWAGGADNKANWSAEYIRTLNRNAATDSADIVMYNPAGVMMMDDGLYGNISGQYIVKDYNNKINGTDFDQNEPSIVPGLYAVYKSGPFAGFLGVTNVLGGGKVKYDDGDFTTTALGLGIMQLANMGLTAAAPQLAQLGIVLPQTGYYSTISSQKLEAEAVGLGYTLGGAYKFNDMFSMSLALRYVDSSRKASGSVTVNPMLSITGVNDPITASVDYKEDASGWGGVIGFDITPSDAVNIGIRYETQVDLKYDQTIKEDTLGVLGALGVTDGGTRKHNLPGILAAGVSYKFGGNWRAEADLTYYLDDSANSDSISSNGYDMGVMVEYGFSDTLKGSLGYMYTDTGVKKTEDMTPELPELNASTLGTGVAWEASPGFVINLSIGHVFYQSESFTIATSATTDATIEYEKDVTFMGLGFQYKFF